MHEYGWSRKYTIWELPCSAGIKYCAAIEERITGRNVLADNQQKKLLEALAKHQAELNEELGL